MPLQNAPGEEIDEWVEGLPHEQLRVREDARWLALLRSGCTTLAAAEEDDDMEGQDETRFFKCGSDRFPCRIVEAWGSREPPAGWPDGARPASPAGILHCGPWSNALKGAFGPVGLRVQAQRPQTSPSQTQTAPRCAPQCVGHGGGAPWVDASSTDQSADTEDPGGRPLRSSCSLCATLSFDVVSHEWIRVHISRSLNGGSTPSATGICNVFRCQRDHLTIP
jgi:hypothetical protein